MLKRLQLLTAKPVLYVGNVDEAAAATGNALSRERGRSHGQGRRRRRGGRSRAAIEAEIASCPTPSSTEFLESLGPDGAGPRPRDPRRLRAARPA